MKRCNSCGAEMDDTSIYCPACGFRSDSDWEDESTDFGEKKTAAPDPSAHPMKWHKFLTVVMIFGGIFSIVNGLMYFTGMQYEQRGASADLVYSVYPGLKSCDWFMGVVMIAMGIFQFVVVSRLRKYKANGPASLKVLYILSIGVSLVYMFWATSATGISMFNGSNLGTVAAAAAMLFINNSYYAKRSDLFVN